MPRWRPPTIRSPRLWRRPANMSAANPAPNDFYLGDPLAIGFTDHAQTIPVMIGTVLDEFMGFGPGNPNRNTMTTEEARAMVAGYFGEDPCRRDESRCLKKPIPARPLRPHPAGHRFPHPDQAFVEKKSAHSRGARPTPTSSPTTSRWTRAAAPGTARRSRLSSTIPSWSPSATAPASRTSWSTRCSPAWVNFARYGNPNDPSIPEWPASKPGDEALHDLRHHLRSPS